MLKCMVLDTVLSLLTILFAIPPFGTGLQLASIDRSDAAK